MFTIFDCLCALLQISKKPQANHNSFLIKFRLSNQKGLDLGLNPPNHKKYTPKKIVYYYFYQLATFHNQNFYDLKVIFQNVLYLVC